MTILSRHHQRDIRNAALSALHYIAFDQKCEVSDIIALLIQSQPEKSTSQAPAADAPVQAPAGDQVEDDAPSSSTDLSQAKASTDGGATEQDIEMPADGVTGDASRASDGAGTVASTSETQHEGSAGQSGELVQSKADAAGGTEEPIEAEAPAALISPEMAPSCEVALAAATGESPVISSAGDTSAQPAGGDNEVAPTLPQTDASDAADAGGQRADAEALGSAVETGATGKSAGASAPAAPDYKSIIRKCHEQHPDWPARMVARHLGIHVNRVTNLVVKLDLKLPTVAEYNAARVQKRALELAAAPTKKTAPLLPPRPSFNPKTSLERKVYALHCQRPNWTPSMVAKDLGVKVDGVISILSRIRQQTIVPANVEAKPNFNGRRDMIDHYAAIAKRLGKPS